MILREAISLFNFRSITDGVPTGMYHENSKTIRIYFEVFDWFEFGIYDFGHQEDRDKRVEYILSKKLLDMKVATLDHSDEMSIVEIHLDNA